MDGSVTVNVPKTRCEEAVKIEVIRNATAVTAMKSDNTIDLYYDTRADEIVASMTQKAKWLRLQVLSMDGKEVAQGGATNANRIICSLKQIPQGGYVCRLNVDGQVVTRKFVK